MIEQAKGPGESDQTFEVQLKHLVSVSKRALKRVRSKLLKQEEELAEASKHAWFAQIADSLLAHPDKVARGASSALIENIHTNGEETITLDPATSVFDNAEEFYRKARRSKRGLSIIETKVLETRNEEDRINQLAERLSAIQAEVSSTDENSLLAKASEIRNALENVGILPKTKTPLGRQEPDRPPYRTITIDDCLVYIGKNDVQNDELSTRFAKPWDIWMHVAACPGSHVVIRREKNTPWPPKETLVKVASFAVWFSKAKHTSYADVHVTEARYVHKRRHSPPGEVMLDQFKTLRVAPKSPQEFFGGDYDT